VTITAGVILASARRVALVAVIVPTGLIAVAPAQVAAASETRLFTPSFNNNTVNTTYPVSLPAINGRRQLAITQRHFSVMP
jgi:hypothetical protein